MRSKITKNSKLFFLVLCGFTFLVLSLCLKESGEEAKKLSSLNTKYGLVSVESLDYENSDSDNLGYIFVPDLLTTSVFDFLKPQIELLVKFKSGGNVYFLKNIFVLKLRTGADPKEIAKQYESIDIISYAEPNFDVELSESLDSAVESDENAGEDSENSSKSDIVVAVIDSGVDIAHKDLKDKIVSGYDFVSKDENPNDNYGHGTHIAGIIAKNSSAKIMPIKFTDGKTGKVSDLAKSIKFAADNGADVINLSLGLSERSNLLRDSVDYAAKKNIPMVAAAGNYNTSKKYYPAAYGKVVSVTGLANNGSKLPLSNYGTWIDYSVKAQDVYSTKPGDSYGYGTGTSQAAPFISAKIAGILESGENVDFNEIISDLNKISVPAGTGKYLGLLGRTFK